MYYGICENGESILLEVCEKYQTKGHKKVLKQKIVKKILSNFYGNVFNILLP